MNIYYFYRMTDDTGNAPCVFELNYTPTPNLLTLACCKGGQIRKYKNGNITPIQMGLRKTVGDRFLESKNQDDIYIIGIMKAEDGKTRVIYAAKICDVLTMEDYFSNDAYKKRMDCIYEPYETVENLPNNRTYTWKLKRRKNFNPNFHNNDEQNKKDELGKYVLISKDFVYFGGKEIFYIDETIIDLMPKGQESKCYSEIEQSDIRDLKNPTDFVASCFNSKCKSEEPTVRLFNKNCKTKGCQK